MLKHLLRGGGSGLEGDSWIATLGRDDFTDDYYAHNKSVAVAPDGSIYTCGYFKSSDTGTVVTFLVKFNSSGLLQWQKMLSNRREPYGYSITVASDGSVYLAGGIYGNLFLVKFNSSGDIQWQKTFYRAPGVSVAIAPDNSIYVYRYDSSSSILLVKFDSSGIWQWQKRLLNVLYDDDGSFPLAIAPDGSIYICGHLENGLYDDNLYIAKFNSSGDVQWQNAYGRGKNYYEKGQSVAVASDGSVYVCGWTNSAGAGSYDLYLVKFNSSGTVQWQKTLGGSRSDYGYSVAVGPDDSIYVCGVTNGSLIAKFSSSGTVQWQKTLRNTNIYVRWNSIALASDGSVYVCGVSSASNPDKYEFFLAKITDSIIEKDTSTLGSFTFQDASLTLNYVSLWNASYSKVSIDDPMLGEDASSNYPLTVGTPSFTINLYKE